MIKIDIETGFISFPTRWSMPSDEDEQAAEILGKEYVAPTYPGFVDINPELVSSKNEGTDKNESAIRTSDGYCWTITAPLHEINDAIKKFNSLKRIRK